MNLMRKALTIFGVIIVITAIYIGVVGHKHPVFLKYLIGSATNLGRPIDAKVYTDGHINSDIKVYKDPADKNDYLLNLKEFDATGMLHYINIDLDNQWVGRPIGSSHDDYDTINGRLYQSELGSHFANFRDDMKGMDFDPKLTFSDNEIRFNIPQHVLKFDSIRIELNR